MAVTRKKSITSENNDVSCPKVTAARPCTKATEVEPRTKVNSEAD